MLTIRHNMISNSRMLLQSIGKIVITLHNLLLHSGNPFQCCTRKFLSPNKRYYPLNCKHTERQVARSHWNTFAAPLAAWEWVSDPFWSVTIHSNGTLPLDALLGAQCVYTLKIPPNDFYLIQRHKR